MLHGKLYNLQTARQRYVLLTDTLLASLSSVLMVSFLQVFRDAVSGVSM
jgi:hypothetical protein